MGWFRSSRNRANNARDDAKNYTDARLKALEDKMEKKYETQDKQRKQIKINNQKSKALTKKNRQEQKVRLKQNRRNDKIRIEEEALAARWAEVAETDRQLIEEDSDPEMMEAILNGTYRFDLNTGTPTNNYHSVSENLSSTLSFESQSNCNSYSSVTEIELEKMQLTTTATAQNAEELGNIIDEWKLNDNSKYLLVFDEEKKDWYYCEKDEDLDIIIDGYLSDLDFSEDSNLPEYLKMLRNDQLGIEPLVETKNDPFNDQFLMYNKLHMEVYHGQKGDMSRAEQKIRVDKIESIEKSMIETELKKLTGEF